MRIGKWLVSIGLILMLTYGIERMIYGTWAQVFTVIGVMMIMAGTALTAAGPKVRKVIPRTLRQHKR